jgi:hypothetical protein
LKKGRLSKKEQKFIQDNHESLSAEQIAKELDRDEVSVENFILTKAKSTSVLEASYDLRSRPYWSDLVEQFSERELEMFTYHWGRIIGQFRDDVLPTEELQVIDAIKLEILMNRALKEQSKTMRDIEHMEDVVKAEKDKHTADQDRDYVMNLERQLAIYRASIETLSKDYKELGTKKSGMLKDLKATREQRVKRLEDSKQSFMGWIKHIMETPDFRNELGKSMEKMRIASEAKRAQLSAYHSYEDGTIDQPFLTPETTKDD